MFSYRRSESKCYYIRENEFINRYTSVGLNFGLFTVLFMEDLCNVLRKETIYCVFLWVKITMENEANGLNPPPAIISNNNV